MILPADPLLLLHLLLVAALMIIFPYSKLLHMPGCSSAPRATRSTTRASAAHRPLGATAGTTVTGRES
jgi:nitrate reductase gamma subunit